MHDRAGLRALPEDLIDLDALVRAYFDIAPDVANPAQKVTFGTSGHRGSSLDGGFNERHILAIAQAVADYRAAEGVAGPLFIGRDTHALSEPAWRTVIEVLAANAIEILVDSRDGFTPKTCLFLSKDRLIHELWNDAKYIASLYVFSR